MSDVGSRIVDRKSDYFCALCFKLTTKNLSERDLGGSAFITFHSGWRCELSHQLLKDCSGLGCALRKSRSFWLFVLTQLSNTATSIVKPNCKQNCHGEGR